MSAREHVPALDGVRALAILLVVPHNADRFNDATGFFWPFALIAHSGWIGVQLFFVLSGFLITGNLLDSRNATNYYSSFYARRVLRIFPLYYLTIAFAMLILPALLPLSAAQLQSNHNQIWLWTFLSNWAEPFGRGVDGFPHFWSLAVEEQFYLIWPFVVLRLGSPALTRLSIALILIAPLVRLALLARGLPPETAYMFTCCRMDALAAGAAAAVWFRAPAARAAIEAWSSRALAGALLLLAVGAAVTHGYTAYDFNTLTVGQTILTAAFTIFVLWAALPSRFGPVSLRSFLSMRLIRSIGRYSYAMYILHFGIKALVPYELFATLGKAAPLAYGGAILGGSYCAAALSYALIEKHFLRLKLFFVTHGAPARDAPAAV